MTTSQTAGLNSVRTGPYEISSQLRQVKSNASQDRNMSTLSGLKLIKTGPCQGSSQSKEDEDGSQVSQDKSMLSEVN